MNQRPESDEIIWVAVSETDISPAEQCVRHFMASVDSACAPTKPFSANSSSRNGFTRRGVRLTPLYLDLDARSDRFDPSSPFQSSLTESSVLGPACMVKSR